MLCGESMEGNPKKEWTYVYTYYSLCCRADTNTTLQNSYSLIKSLKMKKVGSFFLTLTVLFGRQISRDDFVI